MISFRGRMNTVIYINWPNLRRAHLFTAYKIRPATSSVSNMKENPLTLRNAIVFAHFILVYRVRIQYVNLSKVWINHFKKYYDYKSTKYVFWLNLLFITEHTSYINSIIAIIQLKMTIVSYQLDLLKFNTCVWNI